MATTSNPLLGYSQAELNAAAQKVISSNPTYKFYNVSGLLSAAQSNGTIASLIGTQAKTTKAATTTTTATNTAAAPAATIKLGDPNTSTSSVTSNGITFYPMPASKSSTVTNTAQWVATKPGDPAYYSVTVDSTGKPTVTTKVVFNTSTQYDKNLADRKAQIQGYESAVALSDANAAAVAAGYKDAADQKAALAAAAQKQALASVNAADAAAQKLGYNSAADQAAKEKAAADAAAAAAATASSNLTNSQAAAAKLGLTPEDYVAAVNNLIATNPTYKNRDLSTITSMIGAATGDPSSLILTSAKTVAAQAAADAAAQAKGYANDAAMKTAINQLNNLNIQVKSADGIATLADYIQQAQALKGTLDPAGIAAAEKNILSKDTSLDALLNDVKALQSAGIAVDQPTVNSVGQTLAQTVKTLDDVKAFNTKAQSLGITVPTALVNQIATNAAAGTKSFADLKTLNDQVKAMGGTLAQSTIDSAINSISQASGATTREGLAALQQQAAAAGFKPSQSYIDQQMATITKAEADAAAKAEADALAVKTGFADAAAQQKFTTANQANIDWATNALINKGMSAADAATAVADVVKNYNDSNKFVQGLESLVSSPESYQNFKQVNIPTKLLDATKALNAQLYDTATGNYANLTQDQLNSILQQARDQGLPVNQNYVQKIQGTLDAATQQAAQTQAYAQQNADFQGTLAQPGTEDFGYYVANGFEVAGPGGYQYRAIPENKATGEPGYWVVSQDGGKSYSTLSGNVIGNAQTIAQDISKSNNLVDRLVNVGYDPVQAASLANQGYDAGQAAFEQQQQANIDAQNAAIRARNAEIEAYAAANRPNYAQDDGFKLSFLDKLSLVTLIAVAAAPTISSWFAGDTAGAAALTEGSEAAAGLAEAGMSSSEIAATLEASGIPTAAADVMAESAIAATTGAVDAGAALASSGISAETLAMANATLDPIAALTAAQGWTAVDMAYLATIGVPASVLATAEATNVAMGLPATEVGSTAAAEVAGTVPEGTTAQLIESTPVAPTGAEVAAGPAAPAVDTSQMIPTVDAAGNPGFFDPATGNTLNAAGEVVAESTIPAIGEGTQLAGEMTQGALGGAIAPAEAEFIAADAAQLAAQGLSEAQITQVLAASGVASGVAAAAAATAVSGAAAGGGAAATTTGGAATTGAVAPGAATTGAVAPGAAAAEAEFVAADAAQLAAQGLSQAQIESTLVASGVDSFVAADAAQLAAQGLGSGAISQNIVAAAPNELAAGAVAPTPAVGSGANAPDNIDVGGGYNPAEVPVSDATPTWVNPNPTPDPTLGEAAWDYAKAIADTPLPSLVPKTWGDLALLYGGASLLGPMLVPEPPKIQRKTYAPLGPVEFGNVGKVDMPGTNPGHFVNVPAQYQQQSPVQSKFYWGQHPYQGGATFSPEQYQNVPAAPVQPWGLQQMYNPQTETINNLLAGVQQASQTAPYNIPKAPLV